MQHQPLNTALNWTPHSTYQENSPGWHQGTATIYIASSANAIEEAFKELHVTTLNYKAQERDRISMEIPFFSLDK